MLWQLYAQDKSAIHLVNRELNEPQNSPSMLAE
jgi:hypothetical protein